MKFSNFEGRPNASAAHVGPIAVTVAAQNLRDIVTLHDQTLFVQLIVETAAIRLTVNGTAPTSTLGMPYAVGAEILLSREEADAARLIRSTGSDGAIQAAQYTH